VKRIPALLPTLLASLLILALGGCGKNPEQHLQEGKAHMEKSDYKAAILELKTTLQAQANNGEARRLLGQAYLATNAYAEAEKELRKALELGVAAEQVLPDLAKTLNRMGEQKKVLELALPSTGISGQPLAAFQAMRAEALFSLGKPEEAKQAIAAAQQADSKQVDLLLLQARLAAAEKNPALSHQLIDAALASDGRFIDGYYFKAALFEAEKKPDLAIQAYEKVLTLDAKAYRAHLAISDIQFRRGQKEAGEKALKAAEGTAPNMPLVKYARGIHELRNNNLKAASEALQQVLRTAPDYMPAQLANAMANLGLGNFEQSLKSAQLVLAKQPNNVLAARVIAASQLKTGDAKEALATLAPLLKSRPDDAQLLALAGEAYFQNKDYQRALASLKQAEALVPDNAEIKNRQAASLLALGQTDQALSELEEATKLSDKVSRADIALVTIHLQRKEFDQALQAVDALEKKLPNNALTHNMRAVALLGKQDKANARKSLEKAVALDAKFYPAVANLARLDLTDKQPDAARKRFENLLAKDPNNLKAMLAVAELSLLNKQEKDYVSWLEKAAKAHPNALQPRAQLSRYYLAKKDTGKALAAAHEAVKNNPEDPQALNLLGATQLASNDAKSSVETYRQLAQKAPNSADAQLRLGLALAADKDVGEARKNLNKALQLKADFIPAMDALIRIEMTGKNPDAALQWAKKIQSTQTKSPLGFDREGDILMSQQRFAPAAKAYQQALDKGSGTQGLIKLHSALVRSGETKAAQGKLETWVKGHPTDLAARAYLAGQAMQSGQDKVAIAQYEEILRQRPSEAMALNNLANLYQRNKDPRALTLAEKAYQALPQHTAIQDTLGWILVEQGQQKKGLDLLAKAAGQTGNNPTIQYHYAVALAQDGNKTKAKEVLQKALAGTAKFPEAEAAKALLGSL
jgi:putative PEP-CTERM system TPR-repeat lipoprotein